MAGKLGVDEEATDEQYKAAVRGILNWALYMAVTDSDHLKMENEIPGLMKMLALCLTARAPRVAADLAMELEDGILSDTDASA